MQPGHDNNENLAQTLLRPVMNAAGGALNWFYPIPEDLPTYKANQLLQGLETIRSVTALAVDVLKNQPDWVPFHDTP